MLDTGRDHSSVEHLVGGGVGGIKNMEWPAGLVGEDIDTASNMAMGGVRLRFPNNTLFGCTGTHVHHPGTPW